MKYTKVTFLVFHLDISGNDSKGLQLENRLPISVTFLTFHFDISFLPHTALKK